MPKASRERRRNRRVDFQAQLRIVCVFDHRHPMSWGIGGWRLTAFLAKIGPEAAKPLQARVGREVIQPDEISIYAAKKTGKTAISAVSSAATVSCALPFSEVTAVDVEDLNPRVRAIGNKHAAMCIESESPFQRAA